MKKTIIIFAFLGILSSSCSSDGGSGNKPLTFENVQGQWNIKQLILPGGSKEDYANKCPQNKDYIDFFFPRNMKFYMYYEDTCTQLITQEQCSDFVLMTDTNTILQCNSFLNNGHVSKLTAHEMQIDFPESRIFSYSNSQVTIKGLVLTR